MSFPPPYLSIYRSASESTSPILSSITQRIRLLDPTYVARARENPGPWFTPSFERGSAEVSGTGVVGGCFNLFRHVVNQAWFAPIFGLGCFAVYNWVVHDTTRYRFNELIRTMASQALRSLNRAPVEFMRTYRETFRETPLPSLVGSNKTHTHPNSARSRSAAIAIASNFANKVGLSVCVYQQSKSDQDFPATTGGRCYYWHKDVDTDAQHFAPEPNDLILMVDVDYYVDMPTFLLNYNNPVMLYTFQPESPAAVRDEYSYTSHSDHVFEYIVSGGAKYRHKVWDYGQDVFIVSNWMTCKSYIVERKRMDADHSLVLLVPLGVYSWIAKPLSFILDGEPLKALSFVRGGFGVVDTLVKGDGHNRHICKLGDFMIVTLPRSKFDAIKAAVDNSKNPATLSSIMLWFSPDDYEDPRASAAILLEFLLRNKGIDVQVPTFLPAINGIRNYQLIRDPSDYDPDAKSLMKAFMSPILHAAFVPARTLGNEYFSLKGRVLAPQRSALTSAQPSTFMYRCMVEFATCIIPDHFKHKGMLCEVDDVYERQGRPSQRALLAAVDGCSDPAGKPGSTFLKAEPYQKIAAPRTITTFPTGTKRDYSRIIYPFSDYIIAQCSWYAFGKSPVEIADQVAEICSTARLRKMNVNASDFSKQDGHVVAIMRDLERTLLLRYFPPKDHEFIIAQHSNQYRRQMVTKLGIQYTVDYFRGAGSLETAIFNSLLSKFWDYHARRLASYDVSEAYSNLGLFGGDDTLTISLRDPKFFLESANNIGQVVELQEFPPDSHGVNFLSRFYTEEVWTGNPSSTCDLARTLSKLHVMPNSSVEPLVKLKQKLMGLYLTDAQTPIISKILTTAIRLGMDVRSSKDNQIDLQLASWWAQYDINVNWPNDSIDKNSWLDMYLPRADVSALVEYLDRAEEITQLLTMPLIQAPEIPPATSLAVLDGEFLVGKPDTTTDKQLLASEDTVIDTAFNKLKITKDSNIVCAKFLKGECQYGDKCRFRHTGRQVCRFDGAGTCRKGDKCEYLHVSDKVPYEGARLTVPTAFKRPECSFCHGPHHSRECASRRPKPTLATMPEKKPKPSASLVPVSSQPPISPELSRALRNPDDSPKLLAEDRQQQSTPPSSPEN